MRVSATYSSWVGGVCVCMECYESKHTNLLPRQTVNEAVNNEGTFSRWWVGKETKRGFLILGLYLYSCNVTCEYIHTWPYEARAAFYWSESFEGAKVVLCVRGSTIVIRTKSTLLNGAWFNQTPINSMLKGAGGGGGEGQAELVRYSSEPPLLFVL